MAHSMRNETIVYIIDKERKKVLLIYKKRGFGKGKWNGIGGKIEEGEDIKEGAMREVKEEVGVEVRNMKKMGVLLFYNKTGKSREGVVGHVYIAEEYEGEIKESEEAKPEWWSIDNIPYDEMWEDDIYWLPYVLDGNFVFGEFYFENWQLVKYEVKVINEAISEMIKYLEDNKQYNAFFNHTDVETYIYGVIEEAKELLKSKNEEEEKEELGDLINDTFSLLWKYEQERGVKKEEIIKGIIDKMKKRKPHIFKREKKSIEEEMEIWFKSKNTPKEDWKRKLREETKKWLYKLQAIYPELKENKYTQNIKAYINDAQHFLDKNMLIEAFEAVIWAWAWYEIGKEKGKI